MFILKPLCVALLRVLIMRVGGQWRPEKALTVSSAAENEPKATKTNANFQDSILY